MDIIFVWQKKEIFRNEFSNEENNASLAQISNMGSLLQSF